VSGKETERRLTRGQAAGIATAPAGPTRAGSPSPRPPRKRGGSRKGMRGAVAAGSRSGIAPLGQAQVVAGKAERRGGQRDRGAEVGAVNVGRRRLMRSSGLAARMRDAQSSGPLPSPPRGGGGSRKGWTVASCRWLRWKWVVGDGWSSRSTLSRPVDVSDARLDRRHDARGKSRTSRFLHGVDFQIQWATNCGQFGLERGRTSRRRFRETDCHEFTCG
jgi:hypothetical protein